MLGSCDEDQIPVQEFGLPLMWKVAERVVNPDHIAPINEKRAGMKMTIPAQ